MVMGVCVRSSDSKIFSYSGSGKRRESASDTGGQSCLDKGKLAV